MRKSRTFALVLGICALGGALVTCSPFGGGTFACSGNASCNTMPGGVCEANGFCSFADDSCGPGGQRYSDGPTAGTCVGSQVPPDAPAAIDAPAGSDAIVVGDAATDAGGRYCAGTFVHLCVPMLPTGTVPLPSTIDTQSSTLCRTDVTDSANMPVTTYCVVTGGTIAGSTVATGTRPLVLMSSGDIAIA